MEEKLKYKIPEPNIKRENHSNLSEVFSMSEHETENPFIDYVYKKPVD